jgi:serine O-acetyltransferase
MPFSTSLTAAELTVYTGRLLANRVPDEIDNTPAETDVAAALERVERCFAGIHRKYYTVEGSSRFDHLNGDHLAAYLYLLANSIYVRDGHVPSAAKLFAVNKALHGLDLFYAVRMPEVFLLAHPVGSVIGNAEHGEELHITQNCTVGNKDGQYPVLGRGVALYAGASVIGATTLGDDVVVGAGSLVVDADVPPHSIVTGRSPERRIQPNRRSVRDRVFSP